MSDIQQTPATRPDSHALRVTFSYDAENIALRRVRRVAMRVMAPTAPEPDERTIGHWLGVEDADGKLVYHIPLHDPMRHSQEVFDDDTGGKPRRKLSGQLSGTFDVLIPDLPGGVRLVLHGPPHGAGTTESALTAVAAPLATHRLDELRNRAAEDPVLGDVP